MYTHLDANRSFPQLSSGQYVSTASVDTVVGFLNVLDLQSIRVYNVVVVRLN